jgi:AcrR family transcriptional regulator
MTKHAIPLRERKYAQTKQAILKAFLKRIKEVHLDKMPVKDICTEVEISEGTFFNYFPKKTDVLDYFISLWSIEVSYQADKVSKDKPLEAIEAVFTYTTDRFMDNAPMIYEIICYIAKQREVLKVKDLTEAEKLIAFPEFKGIEKVKAISLVEIFRPYLEKAIKMGKLPKETNIELTLLILRSIFFGTPLALSQAHVKKLGPIYTTRLKMIWTALRQGNN